LRAAPRVTHVLTSAIAVATGRLPTSRCHTGTKVEPAAARDINAHG